MDARIGLFTGKIYQNVADMNAIRECALFIDNSYLAEGNEELLKQKQEEVKKMCCGCRACDEAKGNKYSR